MLGGPPPEVALAGDELVGLEGGVGRESEVLEREVEVRLVRRERIEVSIDSDRGVFMISVAAELAHMHPQTLRTYEARGLIEPKRSPKNTRLYSRRDVELLQRIQQLTAEGLNLAGVERVLALERRLAELEGKRVPKGGSDAAG